MGFCGTLGANYIDYLVADHDVIPSAASRQHYTEQGILYMPQSYFVNDHKQSARYVLDSAQLPCRAAYGVPEDKFVFCNFNQVNITLKKNSLKLHAKTVTRVWSVTLNCSSAVVLMRNRSDDSSSV
jgi:protein O-GlcNAc transferase